MNQNPLWSIPGMHGPNAGAMTRAFCHPRLARHAAGLCKPHDKLFGREYT